MRPVHFRAYVEDKQMTDHGKNISSPDVRFQAFAIAWALWTIARYVATTGQYIKQGDMKWTYIMPAVMLSGLVISRPSSMGRLASLMLFTAIICLFDLPFKANQQLLSLVVSMLVTFGMLYAVRNFGDGEMQRRHAFTQFAPSIRICVIVVYSWAFIHKLNYDYFGDDGCAFFFYELILEKYGLQDLSNTFGDGISRESFIFFLISLVILLAEGSLAVLLVFQRTLRPALMMMLVLHVTFMVIPDRFVGSFSATMWAMAACFVPNSVWLSTRDFLRRLPISPRPPSTWSWFGLSILIGILLIAFASGLPRLTRYAPLASTGLNIMLWTPVALMMFFIILKSQKSFWTTKGPRTRAYWIPSARRWTLVIPVLMFTCGLMLYTDIRNETGFAMFSNMRSDPGRNNHFFIPRITVMNDGNDQGVIVLESDNERIKLFMNDGRRRYPSKLTWFELRRLITLEQGDIAITYQRDGEEVVTVTREMNPDDPLFQALGPIESRLRLFTTIPISEEDCPCRH